MLVSFPIDSKSRIPATLGYAIERIESQRIKLKDLFGGEYES